MKYYTSNLNYNSFNNFYYKMLLINNLYTNKSCCDDHEVAPKVIIRVKLV